MFFPEKIKNIKSSDRVLEIGPGALPHPRSDVFLDLAFETEEQARSQRGDAEAIELEKPVVYYDGTTFPFADGEFDYVICSHVIEHVPDVNLFLNELFRVASAGYLEYPTIYYEYLYNFDVHLNVAKWKNDTLYLLKKSDLPLNAFAPVQALLYQSLERQHFQLVDGLCQFMFEGFEWRDPFPFVQTASIGDVVFDYFSVPHHQERRRGPLARVLNRLRSLKRTGNT